MDNFKLNIIYDYLDESEELKNLSDDEVIYDFITTCISDEISE